jgi:hypothetical protein
MNALGRALEDYLALRNGLGHDLVGATAGASQTSPP